MKHYIFIFLFSLLLAFGSSQRSQPSAPVIGILTIPSDDFSDYPVNSWSYFSSSYVKFLESGGAQVVPIQYDLPKENITYLLDRVNGVLFTGGTNAMVNPDGSYPPITNTLSFILDYIVQKNQNGTYYPLWGTCMGFQAIGCLLQKNFSILTDDCVGCNGICKNNTWNTAYQSRLFAQLPEDLHEKMTYADLSPFFHYDMFHADTFENANPLNQYLKAITYSYDQTGVKYISSFEGTSLPFYATQFHQEVPTFQWNELVPINHSPDAIRLQQHLAKFFVNETKKNPNTFPDQQQYLIDNYNPVIILGSSYTSLYFFPAVNSTTSQEEFIDHYTILE